MKNEYEQAAEILERAADGFESGRYGWVQCVARYRNMNGQVTAYCSVGALNHEAGLYEDHNLPRLPYALADLALQRATDYDYTPGWNDHPLRTKDEVIDKMKEAAKELRNRA